MKLMIPVLLSLPLLLAPWNPALGVGEASSLVTVRELMRLEGEQALVAARQRRGQAMPARATASGDVGGSAERSDSLKLVGIYGVGKRLFAEVRSGSKAWLFLNGQSQPVGRTSEKSVYRLRELSGSCVRLERQGDETVLCLPSGGRQ